MRARHSGEPRQNISYLTPNPVAACHSSTTQITSTQTHPLMLSTSRHAWAKSPLAPCVARSFVRGAATTTRAKLSYARLNQTTPLAKELAKTGLWDPRIEKAIKRAAVGDAKTRQKRRPDPEKRLVPKGDKSRVNIVDEKLCDDILKYLGPTLQRHVGCDLVDINPGAGLWSRKLHDVLQPRSHVLMEPDDDFYRPFLEPILSRPNTQLIPQSGILWKELNQVLKHIPNQTPQSSGRDVPPQRNDTLLVTANLSFFPKRRYRRFESVTQLVLFQLLSSIRSAQLFQKYGLVRMLIWTGADDHKSFISRNVQSRRASAFDAETSCEWMAEVAAKDALLDPTTKDWYVRDRWIEVDSTLATLERMKKNGFEIPEGRKMESTKRAEAYARADGKKYTEEMIPELQRAYLAELEEMERAFAAGEIEQNYKSKDWKRLSFLRSQRARHQEESREFKVLLEEMYELDRLQREGSVPKAELAERDRAWNEKVKLLGKNPMVDFRLVRDNMHVFRQDPPALLWDRRPYEPLAVRAEEFYPTVEATLLDIQPKAMHPLFRETGPESSRAGDILELIQRSLMATSLEPLSSSLERIWPGAGEGILQHCPSLRDSARGGMPGTGQAEICARALNETQWAELLEAFMQWPFRPSYEELIGRLTDDSDDADDDVGGGSSFSADAALS
ncbi:uncharacterized protein CTRU02_207920 [Colletotrichum truncatum]|uniref:Uncharacterized protein n=1 Tax=Colletotrichum truncatum TaxID=5467 RepID=A0ACC3Z287_COLTU|nr:uncharacterized protein CTRU02_11057 [Colletotrichum truncatum]KAF6786559.1 hypothetical protein CTRU02_11057 [Colletotrichum truncatum]